MANTANEGSPRLWEWMVLIVGLALGCWLFFTDNNVSGSSEIVLLSVVALLGSLSVMSVPFLIGERVAEWRGRRTTRSRRWGPGKLAWFSQGMAVWLLWPPMIIKRAGGGRFGEASSSVCYIYGTPLMAVYVTAALLLSGWLRPCRRHRRGRRVPIEREAMPWRERLGLLLQLAWACTGLYVLWLIYSDSIR